MKLILNLQSFSDIITNSSSEIYICNSNKTKQELEKLLNDYILKNDKIEETISINSYTELLNYNIEDLFGKLCCEDIKKNIIKMFKKGNKFEENGELFLIEINDGLEKTVDFIKNNLGGIYK